MKDKETQRKREQEAKEIEKMLNKFRDQINKEARVEVIPLKAKVVFEAEEVKDIE